MYTGTHHHNLLTTNGYHHPIVSPFNFNPIQKIIIHKELKRIQWHAVCEMPKIYVNSLIQELLYNSNIGLLACIPVSMDKIGL